MPDLTKTNAGLMRELMKLENQYWKAVQEQDAETAMKLSDDTCIVAGAQGVGKMDRKALASMMKSPTCRIDAFHLGSDAQVTQITEDVAVLAYTVHEDLTVDGKQVSFDAADSSTWVRRDGQWRCALHTESIHGDPFGRDRNPSAPMAVKGLA